MHRKRPSRVQEIVWHKEGVARNSLLVQRGAFNLSLSLMVMVLSEAYDLYSCCGGGLHADSYCGGWDISQYSKAERERC